MKSAVGLRSVAVLAGGMLVTACSLTPGLQGPSPTTPPTTQPAPSPAAPAPTLPPDVVLGTGDVQVTLLWTTDSDLDLHVIGPDGSEIYFEQPTSPDGGQLDHDDIPLCDDTETHAENVFWPEGVAPSGEYQAFVRHFATCSGEGDDESAYVLQIRLNGQIAVTDEETLAVEEDSEPVTFSND